MNTRVRLIAFYLPQFHPIPENDAWWGKGFTEWTNVAKAQPLFEGHHQPQLPSDLGFYDLRVPETQRAQSALAREYGIDGFCYHYYWFSGKRLLERPLDAMLRDPSNDMPFCLCWANESWTRRWDGSDHEILAAQEYRPQDPARFIEDALPYLRDPRYIAIDGAPLLIVYRIQELPDAPAVVQTWRDACARNGIAKLHVCAALIRGNREYARFGCDSGVEFPPNNTLVKSVHDRMSLPAEFSGRALLFHELAQEYLDSRYADPNVFRAVFPAWDNTARSKNRALVILNGTPGNYEYWLSEAIRRTRRDHPQGERLVFINAWNEWAEGCHLEPDRTYGRAFLEATRRAKGGTSTLTGFPDTDVPAPRAARGLSFTAELGDLLQRRALHARRRAVEAALPVANRFPRVRAALKKLDRW
jgi:lipopolysaccharide biosynthesis protein